MRAILVVKKAIEKHRASMRPSQAPYLRPKNSIHATATQQPLARQNLANDIGAIGRSLSLGGLGLLY